MCSSSESLVAPMGQERQEWLCRLICSSRRSPALSTVIRKTVRLPRLLERNSCSTGNWVFKMHSTYARHLTYRGNRIPNFPLNATYFILSVVLLSLCPLLPVSLTVRGSGLTDYPASLAHSSLLQMGLWVFLLHGHSCGSLFYYLLLFPLFVSAGTAGILLFATMFLFLDTFFKFYILLHVDHLKHSPTSWCVS